MNLQIQFRKMEPTLALKEHVTVKVKKLHKYVTYPMEVRAILSVEKTNHTAEITCYAEHHELVALAKSKNLYASIDTAIKKLTNQLKKQRDLKKGHTAAHLLGRRRAVRMAADVAAELPHLTKKR